MGGTGATSGVCGRIVGLEVGENAPKGVGWVRSMLDRAERWRSSSKVDVVRERSLD